MAMIADPTGPKRTQAPPKRGLRSSYVAQRIDACGHRAAAEKSGGVLLSQGLTAQVPSALTGLTSVFGMGTGMTLSLSPPKLCVPAVGAADPLDGV